MVYRFELRKNPKSLLVPAIAVLLVAASVTIIVIYNAVVGVIALAVSGYLGYHLFKFFRNTLASRVETTDESITCTTALGSSTTIRWDDLTHAGWYTTDGGYREFFVYAEDEDTLLTIPLQYAGMDALSDDVCEHSGLELLSLSGDDVDGLTDALRQELGSEGDVIDDESEEADPD